MYAAHQKVARLVVSGRMKRPDSFECVDCGQPATQYDHRDYTKPLDVQPTCQSCNLLRGPGYPYNTDTTK